MHRAQSCVFTPLVCYGCTSNLGAPRFHFPRQVLSEEDTAMLARLVTAEDVRFVRADLDLLWGTDIDPEMSPRAVAKFFTCTGVDGDMFKVGSPRKFN